MLLVWLYADTDFSVAAVYKNLHPASASLI